MLKKIISYLIIFSVLHSNMAWSSREGEQYSQDFKRSSVTRQPRPPAKLPVENKTNSATQPRTHHREPLNVSVTQPTQKDINNQQNSRSMDNFATAPSLRSSSKKKPLSDKRRSSPNGEESEREDSSPKTSSSPMELDTKSSPTSSMSDSSPTKQSPRDDKSQTSSLMEVSPLEKGGDQRKGVERLESQTLGPRFFDFTSSGETESFSNSSDEPLAGAPLAAVEFPKKDTPVKRAKLELPGDVEKQKEGKGKEEASKSISPVVSLSQQCDKEAAEKTPLLNPGGPGHQDQDFQGDKRKNLLSDKTPPQDPVSLDEEDGDIVFKVEERQDRPLPEFFPAWLLAPYEPQNGEVPFVEGPSTQKSLNINLAPTEEETFQLVPQTNLQHLLSSLSPEEREKLVYLKRQILDEEYTKGQKAAVGAGAVIGMVLSAAMVSVFMGGIFYLSDVDRWLWLDSDAFLYTMCVLIIPTIQADAIPRNAILLKKAVTSIAEGVVDKVRVCFTSVASLFPALIAPGYVAILELDNMDATHTHGIKNQFAIAMIVFCPFLFADSFISNFDIAWKMSDDFKKWADKSHSLVARFFKHYVSLSPPLSEEDVLRQTAFQSLEFFIHALPVMSPEQLKNVTKNVFDGKNVFDDKNVSQDRIKDFNLEERELAHAFSLFSYLFSWDGEIEEAKPHVQSRYETNTDRLTYFDLAAGTPMRLLALQLVLSTIVGLIPGLKESKQALGWGLGVLGLPFQTAFEYQGMKNFFRDFCANEEPQGHESHPILRKTAKSSSAFLGFVFVLPLLVLCLQTCDETLESYWGMVSGAFFLFAEFATLTTLFEDSYNRKVASSIADVLPQTRQYEEDRLIQLARETQSQLGRFDHKTLTNMKEIHPQKIKGNVF